MPFAPYIHLPPYSSFIFDTFALSWSQECDWWKSYAKTGSNDPSLLHTLCHLSSLDQLVPNVSHLRSVLVVRFTGRAGRAAR